LSESGFNVSAIDASSEMIKIAKTKTKNAFFKEGFMQSFKFTKKFDVILCLFTSINYNPKKEALKKTLLNFYNHCSEGGIVIFDLGIIKGQEKEKEGVFIHTYSKENLEIARINQWKPSKKKKDVFDANSLIFIKENGRIDFEIDEHELSLFSVEEIKLIMKKLGFKVEMYEDFNLKKYVDKSKRVIFVGQK
jgi:SAM-dependent methyltransferase